MHVRGSIIKNIMNNLDYQFQPAGLPIKFLTTWVCIPWSTCLVTIITVHLDAFALVLLCAMRTSNVFYTGVCITPKRCTRSVA